jgi:hypothetical protein
MRASVVLAAGLLLVAGGRSPAWGFVPYRTSDKSHAFYWPTSCVPLNVYTGSFAELPRDQVLHALEAAARTWSHDGAGCTYMNIELLPGSGDLPHQANDSRNVLVFRTDRWCRWSDAPSECNYDPSALAVTSVFAKGDGHIIDGDIEVNAAMGSILWMDADVMRLPGRHDLQNAITHEMGHFLGFDHTCYQPFANKERPNDDQGNPAPDCGDTAPEAIKATTMYDSTSAGETSKRMLSEDDQKAVCQTYPPALDPKICTVNLVDDSCGCTTRPGPATRWRDGAAALAFVALSLTLARWRRRRVG